MSDELSPTLQEELSHLDALHALRDYLPDEGPPADWNRLPSLLAPLWDWFNGDDPSFEAHKLGRLVSPRWDPASGVLTFEVERHGGPVLGSTYAEIQTWAVELRRDDLTGCAHVIGTRRVQIKRPQPRWDHDAAASQIAAAVADHADHPAVRWLDEGRVRINLSSVLPPGSLQTTEGRRRRLRAALLDRLAGLGYAHVGRMVFAREPVAEALRREVASIVKDEIAKKLGEAPR